MREKKERLLIQVQTPVYFLIETKESHQSVGPVEVLIRTHKSADYVNRYLYAGTGNHHCTTSITSSLVIILVILVSPLLTYPRFQATAIT